MVPGRACLRKARGNICDRIHNPGSFRTGHDSCPRGDDHAGKRIVVIEEFFQMFPARALFLIAGCPSLQLDKDHSESIDRMGWLPQHPAELSICSGTCPEVTNGRHRLSYLNKMGNLDIDIPVTIKVRSLS